MLKLLTLITTLGLALSSRLLAIGIKIEPSYGGQSTSYAQGINQIPWEGSSAIDHITNQFPLETSVVGTNDTTFATQATTFDNTDLQAVFSFNSSQLVNRTDSYCGQTYTGMWFYFTLTEDVNYAINGTFSGALLPANTTVSAGIATASILLGQDNSPWLYTAQAGRRVWLLVSKPSKRGMQSCSHRSQSSSHLSSFTYLQSTTTYVRSRISVIILLERATI
jgi:hypothetical protein